MPYIFAEAAESASKGWPVSLRAMCLEFPDDPTCWHLDRQFMFGSKLLVAPVFTEDGQVEFYLPPGEWYSWWTGKVETGPGWRKEKHGFDTLPMYWREGSVVVLGPEVNDEGENSFDYDWFGEGGEVCQYGTQPGSTTLLIDNKGVNIGELVVTEAGSLEGTKVLRGNWE